MIDTTQTRTVRDISFADPAFLADPWTDLLRLQQEAPIFWSDNQRGWIISRHEDVKAAFSDRRLSSARGSQLFGGLSDELRQRLSETIKFNALNVNRLDGRDHIRIRTLLMKAFSNGSVRAITPAIRSITDTLLARMEVLREFDFVRQVSAVLPTKVIQHMLGIPDSNSEQLFTLASNFTAATGAATVTPELLLRLDDSIRTMNHIFSDLIAERQAAPRDDMISALVHARDGLNRLDGDELLACLHSIIVAGVETTAHSLANGLVELVRHPEVATQVEGNEERALPVVTEMLRYPGTTKCMTRLAGEDFDWHGHEIKKGDLVWIMIAGANLDPEVFADARSLQPDRDNSAAMSFGPGLHHCVGHLLTRTEQAVFFARAFERFRITLLSDDLSFHPSYIFRGYRELPVRFEAKA